MDEDGALLSVGFALDLYNSFGQLKTLDDLIGATAADAVRELRKIETATMGAVNLTGATAQITAFGNAASREMQTAAREIAKAENAGEALARQIERQTAAFGKSRSELRGMKVETAALAAEQAGLTELANRLIEGEIALQAREAQAAERTAQARISAADLAAQAEVAAMQAVNSQLAERARLEATLERFTGVNRVRATDAGATFSALATQAAEEEARAASAAAAATRRHADEHERLAAMVRGSHSAQMADAEAAERLRMATDPLYAATKRLNAEIAESTRLYHSGATAPAEYARQQEVLQGRLLQTVQAHQAIDQAVGKNRGSMTQLSFQVNDIVTMAMSGAPIFQIFATQAGQIFQVAQMAEGGIKGFVGELAGAAVALAPFALAAGVAAGAFALFDRAVSDGVDTDAMVKSLGLTRAEIKRLKDTSVDAGDVVTATFQVMAERVGLHMGDMSKWWGQALEWMTNTGRNALASLYANYVGTFRAIGSIVRDVFSGKGLGEIVSNAKGQWDQAYNEANAGLKRFGQDVTKQIASNKLADLRKQAAVIKADRTPKKNSDDHAASLAREAAATEAQIRNLYSLADAYQTSGAAALIAEARAKAESEAIKKRGDIDAAVERQIRLSIAQRTADGAKGVAGLREQADAQEQVNGLVAMGLVPAERAQELVQQRIADLPLLHAIEVAQQLGLAAEAAKTTKVLQAQWAVRERLSDATRIAQANTTMAAGVSRIADLQEELRLVHATDIERTRGLALLKAIREAEKLPVGIREDYIAQQVQIADLELQRRIQTEAVNDSLRYQGDLLAAIADNVSIAGRGMADAFGAAGQALGDLASSFAGYLADQERLRAAHKSQLAVISAIKDEELRAQRTQQENALFATRNLTTQVGLYGDMASAAKGFFKQGSDGYQAMAVAEKAFRAVEFALSVRAMAQDAIETASSIARSGARTATKAVEAVVSAISSLPFPLNIAAGAATIAALASIGVGIAGSFGGGKNNLPKANDGTGTVFGDVTAKSESIKRSIDALKDVDTVMLTYSRQMAASLQSIESQIGGFASLVLRTGDVNASAGVNTGFAQDATGKVLEGLITGGGILSKIPIVGGIIGGIGKLIGSLFGTKTKVVGSGLYGDSQSLGDILSSGYDASYYSDVQKKKKFFGLTTSTKYSTNYTDADGGLENQFTLILRGFNDAILAAAGPLGAATDEIQQRLNGFVLNIGKIDLQGLTGTEIEEKLTAVFGKAADEMATAAFPGIEKFQAVGEGLFETLVRVASTVESVTSSLGQLGSSAVVMSTELKMSLAAQFDSVSDFTSAVDGYFESYYTKAEQAAARTAQFATVFDSLGVTMPGTLAAFRQLVEAQDLTTAAGQATYATLLQLAPAFADLQSALNGAKSAADILSERQDLQRQMLELQGDTAAIRALDLAKLDASNRALQEQIWAVQDAQAAAEAAAQLKDAWTSVGDSIMDEVNRIRGLTDGTSSGSFASLLGQFNAATAAARAGDQDAAASLVGLSQSLLNVAGNTATSRQELERIKAQTAASLEATYGLIGAITGATSTPSTSSVLSAAATAAQAAGTTAPANDDVAAGLQALRDEVAQMRNENNAGHAANAGNSGRIARKLDDVTSASGGTAVSVAGAA
ncbi:hypothetical protein [Novosphingobium sp. AP12]|uniref:hypothetical protein n=1 Tax=Novosphingobium sp. AP12 TaxID=1144305 RepID=UPI000271FFBF|nr:hypothetical protein [Novosphingobium sp. AP12]EJL34126.1 hypothetical protein PMI02_00791 [Novosphingobium sp. AP12]